MKILNILSDVDILDLKIHESIIFYIFIAVGTIAILLFIFNLIFKKSSDKKVRKINKNEIQAKENFEIQSKDIENEISLVLRIEKSRKEVLKDESRK